jgi:hypothetical protein
MHVRLTRANADIKEGHSSTKEVPRDLSLGVHRRLADLAPSSNTKSVNLCESGARCLNTGNVAIG